MSVRSVGSFGLAEASGEAECHSPFTGKCLLIILPTSTDRKVSLPALTVSPDSLLLCLSDLTITTFFIIFNLNFPCCRLILFLLLSSTITSRLADSVANMKQGSKQGLFLRVSTWCQTDLWLSHFKYISWHPVQKKTDTTCFLTILQLAWAN